jgi:hypothetical protein
MRSMALDLLRNLPTEEGNEQLALAQINALAHAGEIDVGRNLGRDLLEDRVGCQLFDPFFRSRVRHVRRPAARHFPKALLHRLDLALNFAEIEVGKPRANIIGRDLAAQDFLQELDSVVNALAVAPRELLSWPTSMSKPQRGQGGGCPGARPLKRRRGSLQPPPIPSAAANLRRRHAVRLAALRSNLANRVIVRNCLIKMKRIKQLLLVVIEPPRHRLPPQRIA